MSKDKRLNNKGNNGCSSPSGCNSPKLSGASPYSQNLNNSNLQKNPSNFKSPLNPLKSTSDLQFPWEQLLPQLRKRFSKLTEDDLLRINGNRDLLLLKLQNKYGLSRLQAEKELVEFLSNCS
jgi:hypothetical protein